MGEEHYWVVDEDDERRGSLLRGPDGFECRLGELEDRRWDRDGRAVVQRLNELHTRVEDLQGICKAKEMQIRNLLSGATMTMLDEEGVRR
jgi:hypothetical protein